MGNSSQNIHLSLISPVNAADRSPDGNLLPEAKERVLEQIESYLSKGTSANVQKIATRLAVSWQTAHDLVDEAINRLNIRPGKRTYLAIQMAYLDDVMWRLDEHREEYGIKNEWDIMVYKLALMREQDRIMFALEPEK